MTRFPDDLKERMARTFGVVEGDPFWAWEQLSTESRWQLAGAARLNRYRWVKVNPGLNEPVGELAGNPVCILMSWAIIGGKPIMFWRPTSQVVDNRLIHAWLEKNCPVFRTNNSDLINIHNVLHKAGCTFAQEER